MVRLRLSRVGAKKKPHYRIVAADARSPRDGRFIEKLGFYNPTTNPKMLQVNLERVDYWISMGAQPSDTVGHLIKRARSNTASPDNG